MIYYYGGDENIALIGVNDFGTGIPTPFMATAPRNLMHEHIESLSYGMITETQRRVQLVAAFEANGTVVAFHNPDAAQRLTSLLALAFDAAMQGPWGDIDDDERTLQ